MTMYVTNLFFLHFKDFQQHVFQLYVNGIVASGAEMKFLRGTD
jgi:hypothetical protein